MWPDAPALRAFLDRAGRRVTLVEVLRGLALGLAIALGVTVVITLLWWSRASSDAVGAGLVFAAAGLTGGALVTLSRRRRSRSVAYDIERAVPGCRNVVITAAELIDESTRVEPYVGEAVCREAARQISGLDTATLFPARRATASLAAIVTGWVIALTVLAAHSPPPASSDSSRSSALDTPLIASVDVIVTPPAYAGQPPQTLHDPARIDALIGSRIHVVAHGDGASVAMETLAGRTTLVAADHKTFTGDATADADGFIALEPLATDGRPGARRLIGVTVTPDHPPRVKITAPGKDIFLPEATRAIDVTIDADDDLALASLSLRYTKVSGSGERFTFAESDVPVVVARTDGRTWKARGTLRLDALGLQQGDVLVYRGIASDRRPGAPRTESDAFIVEITSPGMIAAEGFAMDDREDKYALSQQMVILNTERLLARQSSILADSLNEQSLAIGAEQRAVRAQFVFMMGGELAEEVIAAAGLTDLNEEAEAAGEADLAAGRLLNRGRVALVQSIRFMSRASASLTSADLVKALAEEKAALGYLQQAFSRTRYLLRALTQRERLDLSRRMTGVLAAAARDARPIVEPAVDPTVDALRRVLSRIATLAAEPVFAANASESASRLAQQVLEVDPSADSLLKISGELIAVTGSLRRRQEGEARRLIDDAATRLAAVIRARLMPGPGRPAGTEITRLRGELSDALRRGRGGR